MLDFKLKSRPCNTAPVDSSKNSTFLAINHRAVSLELDTYKGNKKIPHRMTIIRPLQSGWSAVPYKKNQTGVMTKRISEMSASSETGAVIKMYSFEKGGSNMEKGSRRDDLTFEIRNGNVLNFWLDDQRLAQMQRDQPSLPNVIPAFTVCEIQIAPKNTEGALKGSGCKIVDIKPKSFTLHSCMEVSYCKLDDTHATQPTDCPTRRTWSAYRRRSQRRAPICSSTSSRNPTSPTTSSPTNPPSISTSSRKHTSTMRWRARSQGRR